MILRFKGFLRFIAGLLFVLATGYFLALPSETRAEGCEMNAAVFLPLTGPAATLGDDFRLAAQLSIESLPEEIRSRLKVVYEDTQMKAVAAVNAYRSLISRAKPDVLLVAFSESVNAIAPMAEAAKTPLIGCAPSRDYLKGRRFVFRHWVDAESMSPVLVGELMRRGIKRLGLVYSEHPAQSDFANYFKPYAESHGLQFVMVSSVLPDETDLRSVATQIASKSPEGVVYFVLPPQPSAFTKQYRLLDSTTPLFAFINTEGENEIRVAQGAMEGVVYVGPELTAEFVKRFEDRYRGNYPENCSGNFYDMVQMLGKAIAADKCSGDDLREFLMGLKDFDGVGGRYGLNDNREFRFPVELRAIKNGRIAKFKETK